MYLALVTVGEVLRQRAIADPDVPTAYRDPSYLFLALAFLPFSVVGALIVSRRPRNRVGWILCLIGLTAGVQYAADGYSALGFFASPGSLPLATLALWLGQWVIFLPFFMATTLLVLLFPDGRLPSPRWRPFLQLSVAATVLFCAAWAFGRGPMQRSPLDNPFGAPSPLGDVFAVLRPVGWYAIVFMAVGATLSLVERYRRSGADERAQIRWVAYAAVLLAGAFVVTAALFPFVARRTDDAARLLQLASNIVIVVGFAAVPVAAGVAVMRYRLYDIDRLIDRTFVYGSLTAILAGLYAASIKLFQALFVALTGQESDVAVVITTLVLATSFTPVKRRLEAVVEGRFNEPPGEEPAAGVDGSPIEMDGMRAELREYGRRLARLEGLLATRPFPAPEEPKPGIDRPG
jgi:hypothetical protein